MLRGGRTSCGECWGNKSFTEASPVPVQLLILKWYNNNHTHNINPLPISHGEVLNLNRVCFCLQVRPTGLGTTLWAQPAQHWSSTKQHQSLLRQPSNHSCRPCLRGTGTPPTAPPSLSTQTSKTCVSFLSQFHRSFIRGDPSTHIAVL